MRLCLYEHICLTVSSKDRKKVCTYENVRLGAFNNPILWQFATITEKYHCILTLVNKHMRLSLSVVRKYVPIR